MRVNLPVSLLLALLSICGPSSALPFILRREQTSESLAARATYSVIPIDGSGGEGDDSGSTATPVTVIETIKPTPATTTRTVTESSPPVTDTIIITADTTMHTLSSTVSVIDITPTTDAQTTTLTDYDNAPASTASPSTNSSTAAITSKASETVTLNATTSSLQTSTQATSASASVLPYLTTSTSTLPTSTSTLPTTIATTSIPLSSWSSSSSYDDGYWHTSYPAWNDTMTRRSSNMSNTMTLEADQCQVAGLSLLGTSSDNSLAPFQSQHNNVRDISRHNARDTQTTPEVPDYPFVPDDTFDPSLATCGGMQGFDAMFDFKAQPELTGGSPNDAGMDFITDCSPLSGGTSISSRLSPGNAQPSSTTESNDKRSRERNRIAARKCRQKGKQKVAELQEREREESQRNRVLSDCVESLRGEVVHLKNEILQHSQCNRSLGFLLHVLCINDYSDCWSTVLHDRMTDSIAAVSEEVGMASRTGAGNLTTVFAFLESLSASPSQGGIQQFHICCFRTTMVVRKRRAEGLCGNRSVHPGYPTPANALSA
ncbi:hypothetical protein F4779DRAFT_614833 [Xylariaceae sp. FL0662B]|nr:hypothetical protein F4779DRAFT_614833 [Xylariaceae sp. FL0662B]